VIVMYAGKPIEEAPVGPLFDSPKHPYTIGLLRVVPRLDRRGDRLETIEGLPPSFANMPPGCRFAPRCRWKIVQCNQEPTFEALEPQHRVACWRGGEKLSRTPAEHVGHESASSRDLKRPALLKLEAVSKHFGAQTMLRRGHQTRAVDNLSLTVHSGETLGLVGESGCGKTTLGRLVLSLEKPTTGRLLFEDQDLGKLRGGALRRVRRQIQAVFQDPHSSLNPRMTVQQILSEPMSVYRLQGDGRANADKVVDLLDQVGLSADFAVRYPHMLSGGQRQRVGIARALAMQPRFVVCDEPVSALDVSIQGQIINLLRDLQVKHGLTYLFIAHDLAVVRHIADRVAVMYFGQIVELSDSRTLYSSPLHPYTQALLNAVPIPDPSVERRRTKGVLRGELPSASNPPSGCVFRSRCPQASAECAEERPQLKEVRAGHFAACLKVQPSNSLTSLAPSIIAH
jgi:peptide/nickel transport system ATP-binding protein